MSKPKNDSQLHEVPEQAFELDPKLSVILGHFISEVISADSEPRIFATLARNLKDLIPNERASVTLLNSARDQLDVFTLHGVDGVLPSQRISYALYQPKTNQFEITVLAGEDILMLTILTRVLVDYIRTLDPRFLYFYCLLANIYRPIN